MDDRLTEDEFHEMIAICYSVPNYSKERFICKVTENIREFFAAQRRENNTIYNPHRNISLDQSFGDNGTPVSDWLNISDWREWD